MNVEVRRLCDEIKSEYSLTDYISSKGIEVNKNGFISCIFHKEKTPSLQINKGQNHEWFYCHGCHKSGTIIDFYAQSEGISDGKAIYELSKGIEFSFNLEDIHKELFKEDEEDADDSIDTMNVMTSTHCFRYLRKVRSECKKEILAEEFENVNKFLKKFDSCIREREEGSISEFYKKICIDDFLINRFESLEKKK